MQDSYSPEEAATLEALDIDARRRHREADAALLHVKWLEKKANLEWALSQSAPEVASHFEAMERLLGAEKAKQSQLSTSFGIKVRDANGLITPRFAQWYSICCQYDPTSGVRPYSPEAIARGDYAGVPSEDAAPKQHTGEKRHAQAIRLALRATPAATFNQPAQEAWELFLRDCAVENYEDETMEKLGVSLMVDTNDNGKEVIKAVWRQVENGESKDREVFIAFPTFKRYFYKERERRSAPSTAK